VLDRIVKAAVLEVFRARVSTEHLGGVVTAFEEGLVVHTGEDVPASAYAELLGATPAMSALLADLGVGESPAAVASAVELVLEGLHLTKRLNKDALDGRATYRARG
jgi:magnesium chelatase subunit I